MEYITGEILLDVKWNAILWGQVDYIQCVCFLGCHFDLIVYIDN